jgi:DNA-directed RNA polymerase subunit RPC12/RpoP
MGRSAPSQKALRIQFASIVAGVAARDRRVLTTVAMHEDVTQPQMPRRRSSPLQVPDEPPAEERAAARKAARRIFRLYCVACGRSTESTVAERPSLRCSHCGGTMLLELSAD